MVKKRETAGIAPVSDSDKGIVNTLSSSVKNIPALSDAKPHGMKISMALREFYKKKRAGVNPERKQKMPPVVEKLPPGVYGKCSGCGALCASQVSLDDHEYFCETLKQKREKFNRGY